MLTLILQIAILRGNSLPKSKKNSRDSGLRVNELILILAINYKPSHAIVVHPTNEVIIGADEVVSACMARLRLTHPNQGSHWAPDYRPSHLGNRCIDVDRADFARYALLELRPA
jgi:hypothetical protein